ncbi:hypothetical protein M7I_6050 [Glarea lozoyensis 74030]|uniref:Uncharacterized protein n=1 Tax=Glarea lozoyensis (strain ATCC 74030 / MF5533) TaxID=1104152 RepID=H0ETI6_GLAL7|nr:hypothetical protein M7I_6050 [Glarea lozoyensis 74030]
MNMTNLEPNILLGQWGGWNRYNISEALPAVSIRSAHSSGLRMPTKTTPNIAIIAI